MNAKFNISFSLLWMEVITCLLQKLYYYVIYLCTFYDISIILTILVLSDHYFISYQQAK